MHAITLASAGSGLTVRVDAVMDALPETGRPSDVWAAALGLEPDQNAAPAPATTPSGWATNWTG